MRVVIVSHSIVESDCFDANWPLDCSSPTIQIEVIDEATERLLLNKDLIMTYIGIVATLLLTLSAVNSANAQPTSWRDRIEQADNISPHNNLAAGYEHNANNCAPSQSRSVVGENGVLLGYACYDTSN